MRILLVNPSFEYFLSATEVFNPLGYIAIGSYLDAIGEEVKCIDRNVKKVNINRLLDTFKPDLLAVSVIASSGVRDAVKVSKAAHERNIPVMWGGTFPSLRSELILKEDYVDYVIIGEGEYTLRDLLEVMKGNMSVEDCLGLAYKKNGKVIINGDRPFIDLAELPPTNYELFDMEKYILKNAYGGRQLFIYQSKGCPLHCAFCSNTTYHRSTHRSRPVRVIVDEIKYLIEKYHIDIIVFADELWCPNKNDMREFCRLIKEENIKIKWSCFSRLGQFNREDYILMHECGLYAAFIGIESGNQQMLDRIHKNIKVKDVIPYFESLKDIGVAFTTFFIIGYPNETIDQLRDTVNLIQSIPVNTVPVYHFIPLPGTELFNEVIKTRKYTPPKNLKEAAKSMDTITLGKNLSTVPDVDLNVISSRIQWNAFIHKKDDKDVSSKGFAFTVIVNTIKSLVKKGPILCVYEGCKAAAHFLHIFWYAHGHKNIRKKYNLR